MIIGDNIGISKDINESKMDAALEVLNYFTSKDTQRYLFNTGVSFSAISELWYDNDKICKEGLCDIFKDIQFTTEPGFIKEGGENYKKKYQKYIYQFLYEDKTMEETLKHINGINKVCYVSLDTKDSYVGLMCFIFFSVVSALMLLSLIFIFKNDFCPFFIFLSNDFWMITVLGSIVLLWISLFNYERISTVKCHLNILLMSIGYTFNIGPSLYKLIIQYPKENKISTWIKNHNRYIFLFFITLVDILMSGISLLNPYTVKSVLIEDGENFEKCNYNSGYSIIILLLYKFLIVILILYLAFVERNISTSLHDVRFITSALYINIFYFILILILHILKILNYIWYFIFQTVITSIISISNYLFLYISRISIKFEKKEKFRIEETSNNHFKVIIKSNPIGTKTYSSKDELNSK